MLCFAYARLGSGTNLNMCMAAYKMSWNVILKTANPNVNHLKCDINPMAERQSSSNESINKWISKTINVFNYKFSTFVFYDNIFSELNSITATTTTKFSSSGWLSTDWLIFHLAHIVQNSIGMNSCCVPMLCTPDIKIVFTSYKTIKREKSVSFRKDWCFYA